MNINEELCQYLKENNFHDFMLLWRRQYERFGHCGGKIHLPLTDDNRELISGLIGKDYYANSHAVIPYTQLKKALKESRFADADFDEVLMLYFDHNITTRLDVKTRKEHKIEAFFSSILDEKKESPSQQWLRDAYAQQNRVYSRIVQEYQKHPTLCRTQLLAIMEAIDHLPVWSYKKENLAIFASNYTADPHALDKNSFTYYLLFQAIRYHMGDLNEKYNGIEQNELLVKAGLYKDSVNNFCSLAHLNAILPDGNLHPGWKGFYDYFEAFNANMENVLSITGIDRETCSLICIVENPSIFHALLRKAKTSHHAAIGFVCTNGQLNFSSYLLLDKIKEAHIPMLYSGDFDPEGLLIADKLKARYEDDLQLWHYEEQDYLIALSHKIAAKHRLSMLERLKDEKLQALAAAIVEHHGAVGYQENLIIEYLIDLDHILKEREMNNEIIHINFKNDCE